MAMFKYKEFFEHSDDSAFDKLLEPSVARRGRESTVVTAVVMK